MRDIKMRAKEGRKILDEHRRHDLKLSEFNEFYKTYRGEGLFKALETAYEVGVSVGARCSK